MHETQIVVEARPTAIIELENTIKNHIESISSAKSTLKNKREMLSSALLNDETFRLHDSEAKKSAKVKLQTKFQILNIPTNKKLAEEVKTLAHDVKDSQAALSDYLGEYSRMTGVNEIEDKSGKKWRINKKFNISAGQQKMF